MKILNIALVLSIISVASSAQTVLVPGNVKNDSGIGIPYAFVRDVNSNHATFSDSTGVFSIKANPGSSLQAAADAYNITTVKINDPKAGVLITLPKGTDQKRVTSGTIDDSRDNINGINHTFLANSQLIATKTAVAALRTTIVKEGFNQEPTKGSRYLYSKWVPGYGINTSDSIVVELSFAYNYDKLEGKIIYTNDGSNMSMITPQKIKTFFLFDSNGKGHCYENSALFPTKQYVEVLLNTPKYKIYKKVDTKLTRADYHTNGVLEMGNKYDEYVDVVRYYAVGTDNKLQSISLKKSALKKLLGNDADAFMAKAGSREIDEDYLRDLNLSLN